jgi:hypothetical protein
VSTPAGMQTVQTIPAQVSEVSGQLRKAGSVVLDASGYGEILFDPENARQRWEVTAVVLSTSQPPAVTPIPQVSVYVNHPSSPGNSQGSSWAGTKDTLKGLSNVGPCDFLAVVFSGGIPGSVAFANIAGTKYTRTS